MREYTNERFPNNLGSRIYKGTERYNFPIIRGEEKYEPVEWVGFNKAITSHWTDIGVHFYMDDYQFERIWKDADKYVAALSKFKAIVAPDFSTYRDWPRIVQMWNHYRKHYIAARVQDRGVKVYPNIRWSDESSFEWCFDGEPRHSPVAVSSTGSLKEKEARRLFMLGYNEMLKRLEPSEVIFFGRVPEECGGNIVPIRAFYEKFEGDRDET